MAGTLFGIPLSQNVDINGDPLSGAMLFVYAAGTLTPASTFQDSGLTMIQPFPLVADASGRIPQFWVADGTYRARLTDKNSILIYDVDAILAIGPSSGGGGGGGGGGGTVNGFTTGDMIWVPIDGTRTGFVRANGRTIGSGASGATERANADTSSLFGYLWNNFSNSTCPVGGGRGASATADFTANKTIQLFSMQGRLAAGLDTMGNSAAGVITGGTVAASTGGSQAQAITQANLPSVNFTQALTVDAHTHAVGTYAVASHSHTAGTFALLDSSLSNGTGVMRNLTQSTISTLAGGGGNTAVSNVNNIGSTFTLAVNNPAVTGTSAATAPALSGSSATASANTISGTVPSGGSGTALPILSPYILGTWLISL